MKTNPKYIYDILCAYMFQEKHHAGYLGLKYHYVTYIQSNLVVLVVSPAPNGCNGSRQDVPVIHRAIEAFTREQER